MERDKSFFTADLFSPNLNGRRNIFLEKEAEYKRINEQIEQKSSDLFQRIEEFSKSRGLRLGKIGKSKSLYGGDGDSLLTEDEEEIGRTRRGGSNYEDVLDDDDEPDDESTGNEMMTRLNKKTLLSASVTTTVNNAQNDTTRKRQPGRLQRATESVIRSLQSKLVNHEERLADLHLQYREKIQENTILEARVKVMEEEREKMIKMINSLQAAVEKHAKHASDSKSNLSLKESTVGTMRKEMEELKREQRIQSSNATSFQSRLHHSIEENEKLKHQNKSLSQQLREVNAESRQKLDEQAQRINELERQKLVLHSTLQKQLKIVEKMKKCGGREVNLRHHRDPEAEETKSCFSS